MTQTQIDILEIFAEAQAKVPRIDLHVWVAARDAREAQWQRWRPPKRRIVAEPLPVTRMTCDLCGGQLELRAGCTRPAHLGACRR